MGGLSMSRIAALAALVGLIGSAPASAQSVRTYDCWVDDTHEKVVFKFGPGELWEMFDGAWSPNLCEVFDGTCAFEGTDFIAKGDGFEFKFDTLTGRYYYWPEDFDNAERGQCHPQ